MKKKTNLESGFLFLYDWMPVLETLPAKEVKLLLLALIARQREERPLPAFRNPLTDSFARMIEPVICRRLEGAMFAKKGAKAQEDPMGAPVGEPSPKEKKSEEKKIEEKQIKEERAACAASPSPSLSAQERDLLMQEGLPAAYLEARETRAMDLAAVSGRTAPALLREWWRQDRRSFTATRRCDTEPKAAAFDAEDFFQAALDASYRQSAREKG